MKPDGVTNLTPLKDQIDVKECAKIIRAILKQAFPRTSFSVKLDRYSMGHCIDVRWTDGPATKQVQPILDRFVSSGFDGMTDCSYSCGERLWNGVQVDVDGGHVRGTRSQSARLVRAVADRVAYECGCASPVVIEAGWYPQVKADYTPLPFSFHGVLGDDSRSFLTMEDIEGPKDLLAHNSFRSSDLSELVNQISCAVSLEAQSDAKLNLPEYIDKQATVNTSRPEWEAKQRMFEGQDGVLPETAGGSNPNG